MNDQLLTFQSPKDTVRKDGGAFDQFTGATITPRAVVGATLRALQYAEAERDTLFGDDGQTSAGGR